MQGVRACDDPSRAGRPGSIRAVTTPETTEESHAGSGEPATYDVAIVGAGYVGLPLAQVFAEAGRARRARRRRRRSGSPSSTAARATSRTSRPTKLAPLVADGRLGATTDYDVLARRGRDPHRAADAALEAARARPLDRRAAPRARSRSGCGRASSSSSSRRRTRGRPGRAPARPRAGVGPRRRDGLPPRLLARARRPRPRDWTTKNVPKVVGGDQRGVDRRRGGALRLGASTRSTACRRPRRPS